MRRFHALMLQTRVESALVLGGPLCLGLGARRGPPNHWFRNPATPGRALFRRGCRPTPVQQTLKYSQEDTESSLWGEITAQRIQEQYDLWESNG